MPVSIILSCKAFSTLSRVLATHMWTKTPRFSGDLVPGADMTFEVLRSAEFRVAFLGEIALVGTIVLLLNMAI